jgi:hypothetical protein
MSNRIACLGLVAVLMTTGSAGAQTAACGRYPAGAPDHVCSCSGSDRGSVWGSGPYTADSNICAAALHSGVIGAQGGQVRAVAEPGQQSYAGSVRNGVQTSNWGGYGSSFRVEPVRVEAEACRAYPGGAGPYVCGCTGTEQGSVWGSGPYTADSNLCTAARQAGVIGPRGGTVSVLGLGGLGSYAGSDANGVRTSNWGSYGASIVFNRN